MPEPRLKSTGHIAQFLRSRGWRPVRGVQNIWTKRGWYLPLISAFALEEIMEREHGAVIPRDDMTQPALSRLRRLIEDPAWGKQ